MGEGSGEVIKTVLTADSADYRAEFQRAAEIVKAHQERVEALKKAGLSRAVQELQALRAEARGHKDVADGLREEIRLKQDAAELSRRAGISEQTAMALMRERAALEKKIAADRARASAPVSLSGLPIGNLQQVDAANRIAERSKRNMEDFRRGASQGAMGLLEISRAAEDAQYGLRGVLNNVPGIVMSLGGTAGLAGAASLGAVALYQLGKGYLKLLDTIGNDSAVLKAAATWAKVYRERRQALSDLEREQELRESLVTLEREHTAALERNLGMQRGAADVLAAEMSKRERARQLEDEVTAALERQARVRGEFPTGEKDRATEAKRLLEDLKSQEKILKSLNSEASRQDAERFNARASYESRLQANQEEIARLRKEIVSAEANLAAAQAAMQSEGVSRGDYMQAARSASASRAALNERKSRVEALERESEALEGLAKQAEAIGRQGADAINARIAAATKEIAVIKETIEQRKTLNGILANTEALEAQKRDAEARKKALEKQKRDEEKRAREQKRAADDQERLAKELRRRNEGRVEFAGEVMALKLELRGRKDMADALRKELQMRSEAASLSERLGVSEQQALKAIRERERLEKRVEEMKRRQDSPIRRSARDTGRRIDAAFGRRINAGGGRVIEAGGWRPGSLTRSGLREEGARQREMERRMRALGAKGQDPAAGYWERSIGLQESLLKMFQKIGAV